MYGSYFAISRAHHGAEQAFYRGEYYSIQDDLNRRMEYAQDMVYIAKQYNKQQADTHQQADVEPTQAAIDRLRHAKTLSEKYDADLDLENAMTDLYISLQGTNLKAVSYTHLDVYKRQRPVFCLDGFGPGEGSGRYINPVFAFIFF